MPPPDVYKLRQAWNKTEQQLPRFFELESATRRVSVGKFPTPVWNEVRMAPGSLVRHPWLRTAILVVGLCGLVAWQVLEFSRRPAVRATTATDRRGFVDCPTETPSIVPVPISADAERELVDVTDEWKLDFRHVVGPLGTYFMPESIGTGGALADFDGDGRLDLLLVNAGKSPRATGTLSEPLPDGCGLWLQKSAGHFQDVSATSGLKNHGYGGGCAAGDINNDGHIDVLITNYGCDQLFLNRGDATFINITADSGIDDSDWGLSATFCDYDRDGWLDLFVVNYTVDPRYDHSVACGFHHGLVSYCGPHKFQPTVDRLYHNEGVEVREDGTSIIRFKDVTEEAGLAASKTYGMGVLAADFSDDGWPDLFVANDGQPNRLWINQRDGTFREEAAARGVAFNVRGIAEAGMGVASGDVNRDDRTDLIVSHLTTESTTLYLREDDGQFTDATAAKGVDVPTMRHTGWGIALIDLDLDGRLDVPMVNGLVIPCHSGFPFHGEDEFQVRNDTIDNPAAFWLDYADVNQLLMGTPDDRFVAAPQRGGDFLAVTASGRALLHGDLDNDGDVDLIVTNCGGRARLYRNDFRRAGHWLSVRLFDPARSRDALGAEVTVIASKVSRRQVASPASSYLASNDPRLHFGLGDSGSYEEIRVRWPDGPVETATEVFSGGETDRFLELRRGEGRMVKDSKMSPQINSNNHQ